VSNLFVSRKPLITWLALVALVLGQSAAGLHALKHLGSGGDAAGVPTQHVQLCLECASFAPLAGAHGGPAFGLAVASVAAAGVRPFFDVARASTRFAFLFEARAPPR
jgi:hypothetical protein